MSPLTARHGAAGTGNSRTRTRAGTLLTAIFCGFVALLPLVSAVAPKGTVVLLLLAALLAVPAHWLAHRRFPIPDLRFVAVLALLLAWCAIASSWAFNLGDSLVLVVRIAVIFAAGMVLFPIAAALDDAARARVCRWLVGGFVLTLALMAVEVALDYPAIRSLKGASGGSAAIAFSRGAISLSLIVWPVVAFLWDRGIGWKALAIPVVLGVATFVLDSAAATLGFAVGVAALLLILSHRATGRVVTLLAGGGVFVAMPFAAQAIHGLGWHRAGWLDSSARHRVEIWEFSLQRIAEKPLLGWGFDSARHIGALDLDGSEFGLDILPLHPHSAPLQVLLELGAVGAVIALALLWLLARQMDGVPRRSRECGQAMFIATLAIGCVAFGQWQNWWLALLFSIALLVSLTARPDDARP